MPYSRPLCRTADGLWFVDMDADDLSAMTTRNAAAVDFDLLSVARGADGVLYAASNEDDGRDISSPPYTQ